MKLRDLSCALNVAGSQASAATNQEHLRETQKHTGKKCSQGALQLAAIVHYDPLASYWPTASTRERSCSCATSGSSSTSHSAGANNKSHVSLSPLDSLQESERHLWLASECNRKSDGIGGGGGGGCGCGGQMVVLEDVARDESAGQVRKPKTKSSNKLSRLFFTKNKSKQPPPGMIDNQDQDESHRQPTPTQLKPKTREGHPGEESCLRSGVGAMSQVIEFKFDLIVEGERDETQKSDYDDDDDGKFNDDKLCGRSLASAGGATSTTTTTTTSRKILRPIEQRKLLDQVNELVESFVLDSIDVCLMSSGRSGDQRSLASKFEYLLRSAELSLTYAFQLLAAVGPRRGIASSSWRTLTQTECAPQPVDDEHSVELQALLFIESAREPLQVIELGAAAASSARGDCSSAREALELMKQIEQQLTAQILTSTESHSSAALMINVKLKQQVQGGLFTNRMCLLDLGERPKSSQLRPMLESIFSGQALAYLKAQKLRLHELEAVATSAATASGNSLSDETKQNKHHHHNASPQHNLARLTKLSQAEWLVYKQLSSALIKSLMIVHCRRLAPASSASTSTSTSGDSEHQEARVRCTEAHLMEYNLNLLEFASAIKRAAALRLRRRRRHLRSHMRNQTTGSNLSLASDIQNNNNYKFYGSSPAGDNQRQHQHHHHDLLISSPLRNAKTPMHRHDNQWPRCESPPRQHGQLPVLPDHLIERYHQLHSSRGGRRHRSQRHLRHQHRHPRHEPDSAECWRSSRHANARAASLNRRRSHDLLAVSSTSMSSSAASWCHHCCDKLEVGSQMSSSSGSQRSSSSARVGRQLLAEGLHATDDDLDNSLATTTLHSASLNAARNRQHPRRPSATSTSIRAAPVGWPAGPASSVASWAARARLQLQHRRALDMQSSPSEKSAGGTLDDSMELQSFRSSSSGVTNVVTLAREARPSSRGPELELNPDDLIPDPPSPLEAECDPVAPLVAEPPRQLKLEQFLNRLTVGGAIGGGGGGGGGPPTLPVDLARQPYSRQGEDEDEDDDDDDDDCRSHSSILEHLSSLALESNMKMVKQQRRQQQQQQHNQADPPGGSRVSIVSKESASLQTPIRVKWPLEHANGHLQRMLKSTLKLHQQSQQQQQEQNLLTIDCGAHGMNAPGITTRRPTGTESSNSPRRTTDGFTPPISIESGCSSSSSSGSGSGSSSGASSSSTSSGRHASGGSDQMAAAQLFTGVIKQNT